MERVEYEQQVNWNRRYLRLLDDFKTVTNENEILRRELKNERQTRSSLEVENWQLKHRRK